MSLLAEVYRLPLALLTDLYQLTMAQGYRRAGKGEVEGVFHLFFRKSPFGGGFAVACGLSRVLDFVEGFRFGDEDLAYLALQTARSARTSASRTRAILEQGRPHRAEDRREQRPRRARDREPQGATARASPCGASGRACVGRGGDQASALGGV